MARLPRCLVIGLVGCTLTAIGPPTSAVPTAASPVHVQQAVYSPPRPLTSEPGRLDPRCERGRVLCADKTTRTLRWVVDGEIRMTLAARFGRPDQRTREGAFEVYDK